MLNYVCHPWTVPSICTLPSPHTTHTHPPELSSRSICHFIRYFIIFSDDDLHKIMDINKIFPKPREVEEELKKRKEEDERRAEAEELARIKSLAPPTAPPKMSQLIEEPFTFLFFNINLFSFSFLFPSLN